MSFFNGKKEGQTEETLASLGGQYEIVAPKIDVPTKDIKKIEPKKIMTVKEATELRDKLGEGEKRLIYILYGVANRFDKVQNGGAVAPEFVGRFEAITPDKRVCFSGRRCFLHGRVQFDLIEKLQEGQPVEFVAKLFLARNSASFSGYEYAAEMEHLKAADPIQFVREVAHFATGM